MTRRSLRPHSLPRRQFWLAWAMALCLLGFQGLGHWHRLAHGNGLATQSIAGAETSSSNDSWGHQSGDASCHLFDQLGQDHAPSSLVAAICLAADPVHIAASPWSAAELAARWKRGARGPPFSA